MSWFLTLAGTFAAVDWWAVWQRNRRLEHLAKPAVMVMLILAALAADVDHASTRSWFVVALAFSLAGDVFLMLEREQFVAGLASFLIAHLSYIAGLTAAGVTSPALLAGIALAVVAVAIVGRRIGSAVRNDHAELTVPVWGYIVVISAMLATAIGTANVLAVAGAGLFYASDAVLGWTRFVAPLRHGRLAVIVPYHAGQILLVLALPTL